MSAMSRLVVIFAVAACAMADMYMHNPRGNNNRNCEQNQNRNNANRLFDSQNNGKGGYACPKAQFPDWDTTPTAYFYAGSYIQLEWTNQHGCGSNENLQCQVIWQYACEDTMPNMRDGRPNAAGDAATDRIPDDATTSQDTRYGQHETYDYYQLCKARERNKGLYTADQNMNGRNTAKYTRQDNNGNRYGFECPEERDYYPYWAPSPWKDAAILVDNVKDCPMFQAESENVKGRAVCKDAADATKILQYNNPTSCAQNNGVWTPTPPHNIAAPDCQPGVWTRDNHLGDTREGGMSSYLWKVPMELAGKKTCVLRTRYNISTTDLSNKTDSKSNQGASFPSQDIYVDINGQKGDRILSLAINTDQFGRTFQDRTYVFEVKPWPANVPAGAVIQNLNVRGKRGNIVQTYPAVEYDFTPNRLLIAATDYVHIQFIGSDYNTNRNPNDAEGKQNTDRSNIIQLESLTDNLPAVTGTHFDRILAGATKGVGGEAQILKLDYSKQTMFGSKAETQKFAWLGQDEATCLPKTDINNQNNNQNNGANQDVNNCAKLNQVKYPYFDGGLKQFKEQGKEYNYMCTRTNNFSNRSQKGKITVVGATEFSASGFTANGYNAQGLSKSLLDSNTQNGLPTGTAVLVALGLIVGCAGVGFIAAKIQARR